MFNNVYQLNVSINLFYFWPWLMASVTPPLYGMKFILLYCNQVDNTGSTNNKRKCLSGVKATTRKIVSYGLHKLVTVIMNEFINFSLDGFNFLQFWALQFFSCLPIRRFLVGSFLRS